MHSNDTKILEFNQYLKSDEISYIIYKDLESFIKKRKDGCKNNFEKLSAVKLTDHISCAWGYLMSTIWTSDGIKNKHDVYRGENCKSFVNL